MEVPSLGKRHKRAVGVVVVFMEGFDGRVSRAVGVLHDPVNGLRV